MTSPMAEAPKCHVCGKPQERAFRPFCSRRCANVDLGRWLKGNYAIPTHEAPDSGSNFMAEDDTGE